MAVGTKELTELVIGANEVGIHLITKLKDGIQLGDFVSFWNDLTTDADFKAKVEAAYTGFQAIPEEAGNLDIGEIVALGALQLSYIPKIVEALK